MADLTTYDGRTELTAADMNAVVARAVDGNRLTSGRGLRVYAGPSGTVIEGDQPRTLNGLWGLLTTEGLSGGVGTGWYAWVEQQQQPDGSWKKHPFALSGSVAGGPAGGPAREANGASGLTGMVVWLRRSAVDTAVNGKGQEWVFQVGGKSDHKVIVQGAPDPDKTADYLLTVDSIPSIHFFAWGDGKLGSLVETRGSGPGPALHGIGVQLVPETPSVPQQAKVVWASWDVSLTPDTPDTSWTVTFNGFSTPNPRYDSLMSLAASGTSPVVRITFPAASRTNANGSVTNGSQILGGSKSFNGGAKFPLTDGSLITAGPFTSPGLFFTDPLGGNQISLTWGYPATGPFKVSGCGQYSAAVLFNPSATAVGTITGSGRTHFGMNGHIGIDATINAVDGNGNQLTLIFYNGLLVFN